MACSRELREISLWVMHHPNSYQNRNDNTNGATYEPEFSAIALG
jgi:hypothetical protein